MGFVCLMASLPALFLSFRAGAGAAGFGAGTFLFVVLLSPEAESFTAPRAGFLSESRLSGFAFV